MHGLDVGGTPSRDRAGDQRAKSEHRAGGKESDEVVAFDPEELRLQKMADKERGRNAENKADEGLHQGSAQDEAENASAIGAKSHAETDLGNALADTVGGEAVETDGSKD